jgi:hypothetical protein
MILHLFKKLPGNILKLLLQTRRRQIYSCLAAYCRWGASVLSADPTWVGPWSERKMNGADRGGSKNWYNAEKMIKSQYKGVLVGYETSCRKRIGWRGHR